MEIIKTKEAVLENGDVLVLPIEVNYYYITKQEDLLPFLPELLEFSQQPDNFLAVDIETTGFDPYLNEISLIQLGLPQGVQYILDVRTPAVDASVLKPILEGPCWKLGQNIRFDGKFLMAKYGINIMEKVFDTFIAEKVLRGGEEARNMFSLDMIVFNRIHKVMEIRRHANFSNIGNMGNEGEVDSAKKRMQTSFLSHPKDKPFSPAQLAYAASDAVVIFPVARAQLKALNVPFANMMYDPELELIKDDETREFFKSLYPPTLTLWKTAALEFAFLEVVALDLELGGVGFCLETHKNVMGFVEQDYKKFRKDFLRILGSRSPQKTLLGTAAVNPDSPSQVLTALKGTLGIEIAEEKTDVEVLARLKLELPDDSIQKRAVESLLGYRKMSKFTAGFGDKLAACVHPITKRIHSTINSVIRTGRMSVKHPNFQQIPAVVEWMADTTNKSDEEVKQLKQEIASRPGFRECFIARPGYKFIIADYSQQELRIAASTCNDLFMLNAYKEEKDLHSAMAASILHITYEEFVKVLEDESHPDHKNYKKTRGVAKTVNFGLLYGLSPFNLSNRMKIPIEEAQKMFDTVWETYAGVKEKLEKVHKFAIKTDYSNTVLGRKRLYHDIKEKISWVETARSPERVKSLAEYAGMNYLYEGVNPYSGEANEINFDNMDKVKERMKKRFEGEIARQAGNHMVQGSAGDTTKMAAVLIKRRIKQENLDAVIALIVHDEFVVEAKEEHCDRVKKIVEEEMNSAMKSFFPLVSSVAEGKISDTWLK